MGLLDRLGLKTREPEGEKAALTPDGMPIVQFSPDITRVLRMEGTGYNYAQIYASQPNVRTVIDYIARQGAGLRAKAYEKVPRSPSKPDGRLELDDDPMQYLLDDPWPGNSRYSFYYSLFADMCIYDEWKVRLIRRRVGAPPEALVRVPPPNLTPERDPITGVVLFWRDLRGNRVERDDILWMPGYDPQTNQGSIPPMETLRRLLAEEYARDHAQEQFWRRGLRKDGVIELDKDTKKMSDAARESFLMDAEDALAGSNGYKPFLLEPGMSWKDISWDPNSVQYIQARRVSRQEACAMFHVPPALVAAAENGGQPDDASLNVFYQSTLPPYLERAESELKAKLIPLFALQPEVRRARYIKFNLDDKLRGGFESRAQIMMSLAGGPIVSVNESRARLDLPNTGNPDDDLIYSPSNSLRGGGPQAAPSAPVQTPATGLEPVGTTPTPDSGAASRKMSANLEQALVIDDLNKAKAKAELEHRVFMTEKRARYEERHARTLEKFFDRQRNAVQGGKDVNTDRWNRELADDLYGVALQVVEVIGEDAAKRIGGVWYTDRTHNFLKVNARNFAEGVNEETAKRLDAEEPDLDAIFGEARVNDFAMQRTTFLMNWAVLEAAKQNGAA